MSFSNPMELLLKMGQTQSTQPTSQIQQFMSMGTPKIQPIDPQKFTMAAQNLDKQTLANLVIQARQQGISEEEIESGLNFLLKLH